MKCCKKGMKVIDSRARGSYRYRRYSCSVCGHRVSTVEVPFETSAEEFKKAVDRSLDIRSRARKGQWAPKSGQWASYSDSGL